MSETYTCLVWEPDWVSIKLLTGRRLTEAEKLKYTEEYREKMFSSVGESKSLTHVPWESLPKRQSDGCFPGTTNCAWILSEEEKGYYLGLEAGLALAEQNAKDRAEWEAERQKEAEDQARERDLRGVQWTTTEKIIRDEGGKTTEYLHTITIRGKTYRFTERNVFDFGRVINSPDQEGMATLAYVWQVFSAPAGWRTVREMEPDEREAYRLVSKYGKFAGSDTRM
ncbi:MAG: hypothetical protein J6Q14_08215 [Oscillospiraceae bacterium]|nr:hypothetical protein [Oscillospiraceae bacterium]